MYYWLQPYLFKKKCLLTFNLHFHCTSAAGSMVGFIRTYEGMHYALIYTLKNYLYKNFNLL